MGRRRSPLPVPAHQRAPLEPGQQHHRVFVLAQDVRHIKAVANRAGKLEGILLLELCQLLGALAHHLSKYKKIAVVGGGIGTAPMFQLTRELAAAGVKPDVFFGFRDTPYCMEEYRSIANLVKVSTDTGAVGFHGFVTQLYDPADYDVVLVCGPTVMMKNAARLCAEKGTPCFVSMEKKMACGIGACLGCTCETKGGEGKSVCKNGPVFDATEVFF